MLAHRRPHDGRRADRHPGRLARPRGPPPRSPPSSPWTCRTPGSVRKQALSRATAFNTFVTQNPIAAGRFAADGGRRAVLPRAAPVRAVRRVPRLGHHRPRHAGADPGPADHRAARAIRPILQALAVVGDSGPSRRSPAMRRSSGWTRCPTVQSRHGAARRHPHRAALADLARPPAEHLPPACCPRRPRSPAPCSSPPAPMVPDPSALVAPRLRITYQRTFPFENP